MPNYKTTRDFKRLDFGHESIILYYKNGTSEIWHLSTINGFLKRPNGILFDCNHKCPSGEGLYFFIIKNAYFIYEKLLKSANLLSSQNNCEIPNKEYFKFDHQLYTEDKSYSPMKIYTPTYERSSNRKPSSRFEDKTNQKNMHFGKDRQEELPKHSEWNIEDDVGSKNPRTWLNYNNIPKYTGRNQDRTYYKAYDDVNPKFYSERDTNVKCPDTEDRGLLDFKNIYADDNRKETERHYAQPKDLMKRRFIQKNIETTKNEMSSKDRQWSKDNEIPEYSRMFEKEKQYYKIKDEEYINKYYIPTYSTKNRREEDHYNVDRDQRQRDIGIPKYPLRALKDETKYQEKYEDDKTYRTKNLTYVEPKDRRYQEPQERGKVVTFCGKEQIGNLGYHKTEQKESLKLNKGVLNKFETTFDFNDDIVYPNIYLSEKKFKGNLQKDFKVVVRSRTLLMHDDNDWYNVTCDHSIEGLEN